MFKSAWKSLTEIAAIPFKSSQAEDPVIVKIVGTIEKQVASFAHLDTITAQLEKQIKYFSLTNTATLRNLDSLNINDESGLSMKDIWEQAGHFYNSVGVVNDSVLPSIRETVVYELKKEMDNRSTQFATLKSRVSKLNSQASLCADQEALLKTEKAKESALLQKLGESNPQVQALVEETAKLATAVETLKNEVETERSALHKELEDFHKENAEFLRNSLSRVYDQFVRAFSVMATSLSADIPQEIKDIPNPLFADQKDRVIRFPVGVGTNYQHAIPVKRGSEVRWIFNSGDVDINFSLTLTPGVVSSDALPSDSSETIVIESEHRVGGDGRYAKGSYISDRTGVLCLIWDNSYSLLKSKVVHLRFAVVHPETTEPSPSEAAPAPATTSDEAVVADEVKSVGVPTAPEQGTPTESQENPTTTTTSASESSEKSKEEAPSAESQNKVEEAGSTDCQGKVAETTADVVSETKPNVDVKENEVNQST